MSASETHNLKNINKTIEETLPESEEYIRTGNISRKKVRGYVSTVFGCPYEGALISNSYKSIRSTYLKWELMSCLSETRSVWRIHKQVEQVLEDLLKNFMLEKLAMHFHDTRGTALANIVKSLEMGITIFDSSLVDLGGCPYAPGASGNVATDDLLYMLHEMGIQTGVDQEKLLRAAQFIQK